MVTDVTNPFEMCDLILEFTVLDKQSLQLWTHCTVCQCTTAILQLHYARLQMLDLCFLATITCTNNHGITKCKCKQMLNEGRMADVSRY